MYLKTEIIINVASQESRIAILEEGRLVEILVERSESERMVGDIYNATVAAVLPGMQAAFVDIGLEKAAHIYWRAATVYQTAASNFVDHADALEASCTDLIGASLFTPLTTGPGTWGGALGSTISAADCTR